MSKIGSGQKGWLFSVKELRASLPVVDLLGCLVLLAGFGWYLKQAVSLPPPLNEIDIGPGGFPLLLSIAGIGSVVAVVVSAFIRLFDKVPVLWTSIQRPLSALAGIAIIIAEGIWFREIGTIGSILLFGVLTMLACGERRPIHLIGVPIALAAFIYVVFVLALAVNLP